MSGYPPESGTPADAVPPRAERAACPFSLDLPPYITPPATCSVEGLHVWHNSGDLWWRFDPALQVQNYPPRAEQVLPPVPPRIALGEPIDPEDVEPVCPRRFGRLCVDATDVGRLRAELDGLADDVEKLAAAGERELNADLRGAMDEAEALRRRVDAAPWWRRRAVRRQLLADLLAPCRPAPTRHDTRR